MLENSSREFHNIISPKSIDNDGYEITKENYFEFKGSDCHRILELMQKFFVLSEEEYEELSILFYKILKDIYYNSCLSSTLSDETGVNYDTIDNNGIFGMNVSIDGSFFMSGSSTTGIYMHSNILRKIDDYIYENNIDALDYQAFSHILKDNLKLVKGMSVGGSTNLGAGISYQFVYYPFMESLDNLLGFALTVNGDLEIFNTNFGVEINLSDLSCFGLSVGGEIIDGTPDLGFSASVSCNLGIAQECELEDIDSFYQRMLEDSQTLPNGHGKC